ncbi:E3 ubiquitin-protein ligase RNF220-like [Macrosteles quadrilineatus]|uniref:E3 ubiquitin-protein ligase RNF220-like n=1 Tax=Macrosteles quadrilineatus TaxID=74068 RepID=UPI0023E19C61|nr:E3 ubiquitin-protein ligase RNF220-like [Macrosteles quadrilineatus]
MGSIKETEQNQVLRPVLQFPPPPPVSNNTKEEVDNSTPEERDTATPSSEVTERSTPDEGRGFRRKEKFQADPSCCPVCGVTLRPGELDTHVVQELERLYKLSANVRVRRLSSPHPREHLSSSDGSLEARWETYQRIRANRQSRLRIKYRKRKPDEVACPVCNEPIQGTLEEVNHHVETCLRKHGSINEEEENVDEEGEGNSEVYEEYEWAGQRRIRASTLLVGGFAGAGTASGSRGGGDEEEGDLVVDEDDSATFGPTQYSEVDVVVPSTDSSTEDKEREALRDAIISPSGNGRISNYSANVKKEPMTVDCSRSDEPKTDGDSQVIEALKRIIRDLESESKGVSEEKFLCLICMKNYKKPVISVCCWHVHCEECWLHTLGAKKLCPQCNMITSPSDLRRIYL